MKIKLRPEYNGKFFSELNAGDIFVIGIKHNNKTVYMKIIPYPDLGGFTINCVNLLDYKVYRVSETTLVTPIFGEFVEN